MFLDLTVRNRPKNKIMVVTDPIEPKKVDPIVVERIVKKPSIIPWPFICIVILIVCGYFIIPNLDIITDKDSTELIRQRKELHKTELFIKEMDKEIEKLQKELDDINE